MPGSALRPDATAVTRTARQWPDAPMAPEAGLIQGGPTILFATNELRGLGHLRIALRIAAHVQTDLRDAAFLLLTSATVTHAFPLPRGLEVVRIPGMTVDDNILRYHPTRLPLPFAQIRRLREAIIRTTAQVCRPDLFLVDFRPGGVAGELLPTLRLLKRKGETALVLLLRDILDDPAIVRARWAVDRSVDACKYYDEIWVYGCQRLYDPIREYQWPDDMARKVRFCGYLEVEPAERPRDAVRRSFGLAHERFIVVTVGSGAVGFPVLDAYLRALAHVPDVINLFTLIVGGPALSAEQQLLIRRKSEEISSHHPRRRVEFVDFLPGLVDCMAAADLVVSQAGYNTLMEILRLGVRAIVIPYGALYQEQIIRASLVAKLGLVHAVDPEELSPARLARTIMAALEGEPPTPQRLIRAGFDFNGLQRIGEHVRRVLDRKPEK
jgi:predicted glycosyltransferase